MTLPEIIEPAAIARTLTAGYDNRALANVDDHVVRMSVMTADYHWHHHPDSDETFLVIDGRLGIDFDDGTIELEEGQMATIPAGRVHRTRPLTARTVNLTFERADAASVAVER